MRNEERERKGKWEKIRKRKEARVGRQEDGRSSRAKDGKNVEQVLKQHFSLKERARQSYY